MVINSWICIPDDEAFDLGVVESTFDAAENWIVDNCGLGNVVICDDIPLAVRTLAHNARSVHTADRSPRIPSSTR